MIAVADFFTVGIPSLFPTQYAQMLCGWTSIYLASLTLFHSWWESVVCIDTTLCDCWFHFLALCEMHTTHSLCSRKGGPPRCDTQYVASMHTYMYRCIPEPYQIYTMHIWTPQKQRGLTHTRSIDRKQQYFTYTLLRNGTNWYIAFSVFFQWCSKPKQIWSHSHDFNASNEVIEMSHSHWSSWMMD